MSFYTNRFSMIKSSSILFLIFLHHTYAHSGDENNRHDALMRLIDNRASVLKNFSFKDRQSLDDESVIEKYLCPAETKKDAANIEEVSKHDYKLKYCLFTKKFQKNEERICKKEVKPVFMEINDPDTNSNDCGFTRHHFLHTLSYYDCGGLDELANFRKENALTEPTSYKFDRRFKLRHKICYDTMGKSVLWTQHHIQTPQLFQNPYFQKQREMPETEISTDSYFMDTNLFLTLKRRYELETLKDTSNPGNFIMVPQPLIPAEHYALPMLKKTTNHYINMAPLWEKLVPLMTAIDQGIKQAQMSLESNDTESSNNLSIYTRVTPPKKVDASSKKWYNLLLFQGNIWYKFVVQTNVRSAVLIIIHNTPGNPPSTGCLIGKEQKCNFRMWSKDEKISKRITIDDTKYAYCCEVKTRHIKKIFSQFLFRYDYTIDKYLEIDSLITKAAPLISKL